MNVGGGVVGFQLDTLVVHLVCLPKLLLVSQGLKIKGALRRTLHVVVGQNQTSCCCSVQRLQQRQTFVFLHLSVKSVALCALGEPPDDVLKAVHGRLHLGRVVSGIRLSVLESTRQNTEESASPLKSALVALSWFRIVVFIATTYKSEALLSLGESRVGPQQDALVKVSHGFVHLIQQDLQLREGNGAFRRSACASTLISGRAEPAAREFSAAPPTCPLW